MYIPIRSFKIISYREKYKYIAFQTFARVSLCLSEMQYIMPGDGSAVREFLKLTKIYTYVL